MLFAHLSLFPQERIGLLMDNVYEKVNMQDVSVLNRRDNNRNTHGVIDIFRTTTFGTGSWFRRR